MDTKQYRTRTELNIERNNGQIPGIREIALDAGYSAVKLFSSNSVGVFPSYAKRVDEDFQFIAKAPEESIVYKNFDTGEEWLVGELAQNIMDAGDTSDSEASLYGRDRYMSPMFKVYTEVGLGLGMRTNKYGSPGNDKIVVQTGLPERYMSDEKDLKDVIAGRHHFAIKLGSEPWQKFDFEIDEPDIYVMSQPKGTLFSVCIGKDGKFRPETSDYLSSSVLVFDPGFGTFDLFPIVSGAVRPGETFSDLGMKRVLQETSKQIRKEFGIEIPVPAMQKYLATGVVKQFDKKTFKNVKHDISAILEKASKAVCEEAIERMVNVINMSDYNYLVITGGTGAAWLDILKERFGDDEDIKLLYGNQNDNLDMIYSNVRGYYLYRYNMLGMEGAV